MTALGYRMVGRFAKHKFVYRFPRPPVDWASRDALRNASSVAPVPRNAG